MKILCVIDSLGPGGAQRQLVALASGFKEKGHDVSFLIYHHLSFFKNTLDTANIPVYAIIEPKYFWRLLKMRKFIRQGNYDAVLSFLEAANFICEVSGFPCRKWKLVVGERNADPNIYKSFKLRLYRWFHLFSDYVVSNSNANLKIVNSVNPLLSKVRCKVIYNSVNLVRWNSLPGFEFKKNGKLNLVIVASHIYRKNFIGLIEGMKLLSKDEIDKIEINWYGDRLTQPFYDNSLPEAKQKIECTGLRKSIIFYPATNDITAKIQNADAIGLFSFNEGLPNVVCEGMICAKPVICSNVSDVPELLSHDKNLLFDPADPHSIKQTLRYLISLSKEQLKRIGAENERISKEKFNKEKIVSEYLKLLSS